jgi:hypothetical protein
MEFIEILPEITIMFIVGIVGIASSKMSYKMYKKLPIKPYFYQSLALGCFGLFGFFMSMCQLFKSNILLLGAMITFCLSLMLYTKFFRELFGKQRNYELLQILLSMFFGFIILSLSVFPFEIVNYELVYFPQLVPWVLLYAACFFIIIIDYTIFSFKKIKKEHLSHKLNYFSFTIISSMICTFIAMILFYIFSIPMYNALDVQIIFIMVIFIVLKKYPYINFLALVNPQFITINHSSGLTIYTHQFQSIEMGDLLGGAVTAVNMLFKEVFVHEGIEQIQFRGKVIYSTFRPHFSIIYIDDVYMPFISKVLNEFADSISKKFEKQLETFVGDINKFESIEQEMRRVFYFLPQLIE